MNMREILFRAKAINREEGREYRTRYKNGDWVYGLLSKPYIEVGEYSSVAEMTNTSGVSGIEVDHETIGQYTGALDCYGKKIYEGDILRYTTDYDGLDGFTRTIDTRAVVAWDPDVLGFACKEIGDDSGDLYSWLEMRENPDIEVIGNIHDNPELLGGAPHA